ncbi:MAG: hypothetical protein WC423_12415 [Vulcanimicrobiota bacterium]
MTNPFSIKIVQTTSRAGPVFTMYLSLRPEALFLRNRFRALVCHYQVVPEPICFDLGKDMELVHKVRCTHPPERLTTTCYGVRPDGALELVFRNWGKKDDALGATVG